MYDDPRDHIFTLYPYYNVVIDSAEGCLIRDREGREYLDFASGQLCTSLGHSHPRLTEVAHRQAGKVVNLGNRFFSSATLVACAAISEVCQEGLTKVVLCSTGSEANELAVRMARAATGGHELVGVRKGYYGATYEMLSLSEYVGFMKGLGSRGAGLNRLECPDCLCCPLSLKPASCDIRCIKLSAENLKVDSTGEIAAFLVEPVLGSGGIIVPPAGFFQEVRKLCDEYGALLIADEAQTGLGRTGRWMGMEHSGVVPDICVLSKGLGAGFPVAAVITTEAVEERCIAAPLANMSSHSFDPFGAAIASAAIDIIREEGLVENSERMGQYLRTRLEALASRHEMIANVRGLGLMNGVDTLSPEKGRRDPMYSLALESECLMRGLVVGYSALSGVLRILPPLSVTERELDSALEILEQALVQLEEKGVDLERYMPTHGGSLKLAAAFLGKMF